MQKLPTSVTSLVMIAWCSGCRTSDSLIIFVLIIAVILPSAAVMSKVPDPRDVQIVQGFKFPASFVNVADNLSYKAVAEDVFVIAFPKSGTTWMQHVVTMILNHGLMPSHYEAKGINGVSPYLDRFGGQVIRSSERPFCIKTHLPYRLLPRHPEAKYVLMIRNPKDVCVSFYHHTNMFANFDMDFHSFFRHWITADFPCGDYFTFVKEYMDAKEEGANLLLLSYENMKRDPASHIVKVAEYLGKDYVHELLSDGNKLLDVITRETSFDHMKHQVNSMFARDTPLPTKGGKTEFLRKGTIGDWRRHMTEEESFLVDQKLAEAKLDSIWNRDDVEWI